MPGFSRYLLVLAGSLFLSTGALGQEKKLEPGFVQIFDGKTLDGWRNTKGYIAKDGLLICLGKGG